MKRKTMETVSFTRQLSVAENVDVLVVGAGPAGIGAAVCAARNGARTLVFDQNGCVGGHNRPRRSVYDLL